MAALRKRKLPVPRSTRMSERAGRLIDQDQGASMERKKREGYF